MGGFLSGVSAPELLAALAIPAGAALAYHGGRYTGPIGAGLAGFGGLGLALGQRQYNQQKLQQDIDATYKLGTLYPGNKDAQAAAKALGDARIGSAEALKYMGDRFGQSTAKTQEEYPLSGNGPSKLFAVPSNLAPGSSLSPDPNYTFTRPAASAKKGSPWQVVNEPGVPPYEINKDDGTMRLIQGAPTREYKPDKPEKDTVTWRTETAPDGSEIQVPYFANAATHSLSPGNIVGGSGGGITAEGGSLRTKLDATEQKTVDSIRTLGPQIPRLEGLISALPPDVSPALLAREYAKYRAPFGAFGTVDPRFAAYFQQLGMMKGALTSAQAAGFRGRYMVDMLKAHIPEETDPPARALEKVRGFDEGSFKSALTTYLGGGGASALPSMGGSSSGPGAPPVPGAKFGTYKGKSGWFDPKTSNFYPVGG